MPNMKCVAESAMRFFEHIGAKETASLVKGTALQGEMHALNLLSRGISNPRQEAALGEAIGEVVGRVKSLKAPEVLRTARYSNSFSHLDIDHSLVQLKGITAKPSSTGMTRAVKLRDALAGDLETLRLRGDHTHVYEKINNAGYGTEGLAGGVLLHPGNIQRPNFSTSNRDALYNMSERVRDYAKELDMAHHFPNLFDFISNQKGITATFADHGKLYGIPVDRML